MKVAILKGALKASGGLEKYCMRIARALASRGDEVHLVGFGKPPEPLGSIHVDSVCGLSSISLLQMMRFDRAACRFIDRAAPDTILGFYRNHCRQTHYRAGNGCHRAYLERRKATDSFWKRWSFAVNPLHRYILDCEKTTFESPDLRYLIVNSHLVQREIEHFYPLVDRRKIVVIHNGVEWYEWQQHFDDSFKTPRTSPNLRLLFIGNEWKRKGLEMLFKALQALPKDIELLVVGHDRNQAEFIQKCKMYGLEGRVQFYGRRSDSWRFYAAADVVVIPSTYDPFANVTVEALAMGCFVISSTENGGSEVLQSGTTGLVFGDLHDPEELIEAIRSRYTYRKTRESAEMIRASVQQLDFHNQLNKVLDLL